MKIWNLIKAVLDPYESYEPKTTLPTFNFNNVSEPLPKRATMPRAAPAPLPENVKEKITSIGIRYEKRTDIGTSIEFETWGEKKALLTESEKDEILTKFPKIDKTAIVISKRCWAKNMTVAQTIGELKRANLVYSKTYVTTMRTIFNKNRVEDTG